MTKLNQKTCLNILLFFFLTAQLSFAQTGNIDLKQDNNITVLLDLKKALNKDEVSSERYKIQVYSGHREGANKALKEFSSTFYNWKSSMQYETPNFKIWAGNFRTRLEADRALKKIKKEFNNAFIFKPKKQ